MVEKQFKVIDKTGIHARPASLLVSVANKFNSNINLVYGDKVINLKSILGVMSLGIGLGEEFSINADGADEQGALDDLTKALLNEGLAE